MEREIASIEICDTPHPLEVVRLNYLMANRCAVVSERGWDDADNALYAPGLIFSDRLADDCAAWLHRDLEPTRDAARATIRKLPMRIPT